VAIDASTAAATAGPTTGGRLRSRGHPGLVLTLILTCQLMVVLDATIVNIALPDIRTALHFSSTSLSWVINAYTLTFGGLLLLGARAGDILGRRRAFLAGITVFTAASLVFGAGPDQRDDRAGLLPHPGDGYLRGCAFDFVGDGDDVADDVVAARSSDAGAKDVIVLESAV
jgi:hypothetical protein